MYLSINRNRQITANILSQEVVYFIYFSINFSAFIIIVLFILIIYIFVLDRKLHDTGTIFSIPVLFFQLVHIQTVSLYPPQQSCRGVYWFHHVCLQTNPMSYDNLSCVSQNLLKFCQLFTGGERRIPFFFDGFHFCRSRVIGLDMTENRIFTLCRMIT